MQTEPSISVVKNVTTINRLHFMIGRMVQIFFSQYKSRVQNVADAKFSILQ